jgi:hypothetical protein
MPETGGTTIEVAHHLNEASEPHFPEPHSLLRQSVEIVEALLLALVAITTAWSGYESARWDSVQSKLYEQSTRLRVEGQALEIEANQLHQYHAATVIEWIKAQARGETRLADLFERRMFPEFRPAFEAWKNTDPLHNPSAPAGPFLMRGFKDVRAELASQKNREATDLFEKGSQAREHADDYVRVTVFLATVLLLTAISQRFRSRQIRVVLIALAILMLAVPVWRLIMLPRM